MRKWILPILLFFLVSTGKAQDSCMTAAQFCTGNYYIDTMSVGVPAPTGPNYGCLSSQSSPLWISIYVTGAGDITITGNGVDLADNPLDIDFIYWGPFSSMSGVCYGQLDAAHIVGCDYSTSNLLNFAITSATAGSYYIAMISNYSSSPAVVSYTQTGGSGVASCIMPCSFTGLTAVASACDLADNTYSLSGQLQFSDPPATGTLTVYGSCGGSQTFTAPFTSPQNYSFTGLPSNGNNCFVTAIFSAAPTCNFIQNYSAPIACNPTYSIDEYAGPIAVQLSPNPTNGMLDLQFQTTSKESEIKILDLLGRTIYQELLENSSGTVSKQFDLTAVDKGVYFVRISTTEHSVTKRIVVE